VVLRIWLAHAEKLAIVPATLARLVAIGDQLMALARATAPSDQHTLLLENLVRGFFVFFKTPGQQSSMLALLISSRPLLRFFMDCQIRNAELRETGEWPMESSFLSIRNNEEEKTKVLNFNGNVVKVSHQSQAAPLALQLIDRPLRR
jgi:hypothetical protein